MNQRFNIEIDTNRERALPLEVNITNRGISFWSALGCSRDYRTDSLDRALRSFLREHNRTLVTLFHAERGYGQWWQQLGLEPSGETGL